jgi:spore cortex biosynthesis protein YabQ
MEGQIAQETQLVLISIYSGMVLGMCYDVIRIGRRIKKASPIRSILEDVVFWTAASIYLFHMFLRYNYGSPRYYGVGAAAISMILFEWIVGRHFVAWGSKIIKRFMLIVLKPLKKIGNGFTLIVRALKKHFRVKRRRYKGGKNDI